MIINTISQFLMQYKLTYTCNNEKENEKRLKSKTFNVVTLVTTERGSNQ